MSSQTFYLLLSKTDGQYLGARPHLDESTAYLLLFKEDFEALSYVNTYAADLAHHLRVESIAGTQLKNLLKRWGFQGVGVVKDPLIPTIDFMIMSD